jgi:plasmid stabilization system protein ParE
MTLVFTPTAEAQFDHQVAYSRSRFGEATATKTFVRIESFLGKLAERPQIGTRLDDGLYESAIPRTPFVILYRLEPPLPAPPLSCAFSASSMAHRTARISRPTNADRGASALNFDAPGIKSAQ